MSAIATLVFHLEGEPLHVHFTPLAEAISADNPRQWVAVLLELESALADFRGNVATARRRLQAELDAVDEKVRAADLPMRTARVDDEHHDG